MERLGAEARNLPQTSRKLAAGCVAAPLIRLAKAGSRLSPG